MPEGVTYEPHTNSCRKMHSWETEPILQPGESPSTLEQFPTNNKVYHFHPNMFVRQMKRLGTERAPWMKIAKDEIGTKAYKMGHNPKISEYFNASTNGKGWNDDTNWCGAFISWCVKQVDFKPPKFSARAAMWQFWKQIDIPIYGAIAVRDNGPNDLVDITNPVAEKRTYGGAGHVTFVVGISKDGNYYFCLGGNQGGERKARHVKISKYHKDKIDWFVIPPSYNPDKSEYDLTVMKDSDDIEILNDNNTKN